jgi:aconitate hydratase
MGILPLQFAPGQNAASLGLTGEEVITVAGLADVLEKNFAPGKTITVKANDKTFQAVVRIDTPQEVLYYKHGGILRFVLRQLVEAK